MSAVNELPALMRDRSFWAMTITQFLGAFNDNLFKQLVLLLAVFSVPTAGEATGDLQGHAMALFALPFLLFSGFAGYLSDLYSKQRVIVLCKLAEIVVMLLGMLAFFAYNHTGFAGPLAVLFLMGMQSAFFGPGKYGILPELLRPSDLPKANGIILTTTFVAIILGTACAGFLKVQVPTANQLWLVSAVCVIIAMVGTGTSLMIRRSPAANPQLSFQLESLALPTESRRLLWQDKPLLTALLASCMFWLVGGLVHMSVNALGKQLGLDERTTSLLVASMAIGITVGCLLAGTLSAGQFSSRLVRYGLWGILVCLGLLAIPGGPHGQWLGKNGSLLVLVLLGMFAGIFAVPLQVFLQSRPPPDQKGRMIAAMNFANWVAILLASLIYSGGILALNALGANSSNMFALTAVLIAPVAWWYRPQSEKLS